MSSWIDLSAIWKIVVLGVLAGAGLPALFAIGVTALSRPGRARQATAGGATARAGGPGGDDALIGGSPVGMAIAAICFLIVLAAIGWGIYEVYTIGHAAAHK
jgi:hypothetical protein